ncbi:hypothetical protein Agub_g6281, partial [Astrephomene gubernaculifera]
MQPQPQCATCRCPPAVRRERYSLADFHVTRLYGEGPGWSVCGAVCRWSGAQVVLQTYSEVGNLSGSMALALAAAHSLPYHPALLPLYAVFREPGERAGAGGGTGGAAGGGDDTVVMVYPGGPAQRPLDCTGSGGSGALGSSSLGALGPGGGGGSSYPVSERGVVRGLLQPLGELLALLGG